MPRKPRTKFIFSHLYLESYSFGDSTQFVAIGDEGNLAQSENQKPHLQALQLLLYSSNLRAISSFPPRLRTVASEFKVLILLPSALCLTAVGLCDSWRSPLDEATRTSSANMNSGNLPAVPRNSGQPWSPASRKILTEGCPELNAQCLLLNILVEISYYGGNLK